MTDEPEVEPARRVWKAAHREMTPGDVSLTTKATVAEIVDDGAPSVPADFERLLMAVAEHGTVLKASRVLGMNYDRARQITRSRLWAEAMRYGFQEAGVTPMSLAKLLGEAMKATYPRPIKESTGPLKGKRQIRWLPAWGTRLKAAQMYLDLEVALAKLERLPDAEDDAAGGAKPVSEFVAAEQAGGKTRAEVMALLERRAQQGRRRG